MSPPPARGSPSGVTQHQPAFQGQQGLQGHFQGECRDNRDPPPQNDEEADVASQARDAVRRPSGLEKGLRERTTNLSSGAVLRERRVPSPEGLGATRTRPTRPSHCEARGKGGVACHRDGFLRPVRRAASHFCAPRRSRCPGGTRGNDGVVQGEQNREQCGHGEIVTRLPNGSRR